MLAGLLRSGNAALSWSSGNARRSSSGGTEAAARGQVLLPLRLIAYEPLHVLLPGMTLKSRPGLVFLRLLRPGVQMFNVLRET